MDGEMADRYRDTEDTFRGLVEPAGTQWWATWVAELDGEPVATITLRRLGDERTGLAEVKKVYVAPRGRRRGLAAAALGLAEAECRARGVDVVHLHTGDRQPEALALYAREGWEREPVFAPYDVLDVSVCFRKPVAPAAP